MTPRWPDHPQRCTSDVFVAHHDGADIWYSPQGSPWFVVIGLCDEEWTVGDTPRIQRWLTVMGRNQADAFAAIAAFHGGLTDG